MRWWEHYWRATQGEKWFQIISAFFLKFCIISYMMQVLVFSTENVFRMQIFRLLKESAMTPPQPAPTTRWSETTHRTSNSQNKLKSTVDQVCLQLIFLKAFLTFCNFQMKKKLGKNCPRNSNILVARKPLETFALKHNAFWYNVQHLILNWKWKNISPKISKLFHLI